MYAGGSSYPHELASFEPGYPCGGLPLPGKISTLPRSVSHTSNAQFEDGSPKRHAEECVSRFSGGTCAEPAGQLSAMNSCQANAAACSGVAVGAPPLAGFNSPGTE